MSFPVKEEPLVLRSLVPVYKPYMYLSDDNKSILGPIGEIFDKTVRRFTSFNAVYVPHEGQNYFLHFGQCDKYNCTGIIEMIRTNLADIWMVGAPMDAFNGYINDFYYGPGIIEMSDMITSMSTYSKVSSFRRDLTTSLKSIGIDVYLYLVFALIAFIVINKFSNLNHTQSQDLESESMYKLLWNLIRFGGMHTPFRAKTFTPRLLLILFTIGIFIIISHYHAYLNTNLVIKTSDKNIDTLTDLLNSDLSPYFLKYGPTTQRFHNSPNPVYHKIWNRADFVTIRNLTTFGKLIKSLTVSKGAFIGPSILGSLQENLYCNLKLPNNDEHSIYFSKTQFNKIMWIYFYSSRMDEYKRSKLNLIAYGGIEYGIYNTIASQFLGIVKNFFAGALKSECKEKTNNVQSAKLSIIQLESLTYILLFWLVGNALAIIIFIIQLSVRYCLNRKSKITR